MQERLQEVMEKEGTFKKLAEDAVDKVVAKQLHDSWMALCDPIMTLIQGRRDSFLHCDAYHKQTMELSTHLDAAASAVDDVERSRDAELSHKLSQMEVIWSPLTVLWISCCADTNTMDSSF